MKGTNDKPTREERLAAKLRENLRRRKSQAKAMGGAMKSPPEVVAETLPKSDSDR